jgi:hypothetical protein
VSAPAFTGARLDRAGDGRRRDPVWLAEQRGAPLLLPPRLAIARRLLDRWLAG